MTRDVSVFAPKSPCKILSGDDFSQAFRNEETGEIFVDVVVSDASYKIILGDDTLHAVRVEKNIDGSFNSTSLTVPWTK